ncbi:unannotated protein [freshwater metagenome]|uniref:Unannotated protein n=1 Tax=freshwater metagenome TaxID=449393 RepID=A0A6J7ISX1_9ZZZZ
MTAPPAIKASVATRFVLSTLANNINVAAKAKITTAIEVDHTTTRSDPCIGALTRVKPA